MCFSAEASFIVSGALLVTGVITVRKTTYRKDLPVALIPVIFSIQQMIEGFLWVSLINTEAAPIQLWLSNLYSLFIGIIWPLFAPFAVYCAETDHKRKKIIAGIGVAGLALALHTAIGLVDHLVTAEIINHSIRYHHDVKGQQLTLALYLIATCLPFILSSYKQLFITGIAISAGSLIAYLAYLETFASVWCFFAAIASISIYFYFSHRSKKPPITIA